MNTIDLKDIQQKLYEKLKPSGWADKLKGFILSDDFYSILEQLLGESQKGKRFTPVLKTLFRAFEECPYDELKVVMLTSAPYPTVNDADGIAFSSSISGSIPPSLKYIFEELERTVDQNYVQNPDLKRWSNQGVLMLNIALTTSVGKIDSHTELWQPFMVYLFDMLNSYNPGLVYVFFGDKAKGRRINVNKNNFKFFTPHPIVAKYTENKQWQSGNVFNQINKVVKDHYNTEIIW
jgi:uracil-DNA glycosylase